MRRTSRPSPTAALGGGGGAQLVQPLPPAADPLGEARGALPGLRPIGRLPDRLSQGAPCTLTFWIGCKGPVRDTSWVQIWGLKLACLWYSTMKDRACPPRRI